MGDTASSNQPILQPLVESSIDSTASHPDAVGPLSSDPPTVITSRPPLAPEAVEGGVEIITDRIGAGSLLGHYQLHECIGGGGMGRVYRATDLRLGRLAALKILSPEQTLDRDTVLRFRNEARSAARLNHDGIARVYYTGDENGPPFIAFEFVEGLNIRRLVAERGPLPLGEALGYTVQVAQALAHAGDRGVVHRDIKPSNVLVTPEGRTKLIDMGLARVQRSDDSASDLTASGVTLGTFDYISPEQARDPRLADSRSDIYSLGCTLFYMLAGRPPFPEGTVLQKLLQHQGDEPPDVRGFRPELPEEITRLLRKMMAKDPGRRFQDARQLIAATDSLAHHLGLPLVGVERRAGRAAFPTRMAALERQLPWIAPIAAMVAVAFFLHLVWSPIPETGDRELALGPPARQEISASVDAPKLRAASSSADDPAPPVNGSGSSATAAVSGTDAPPPAAAPAAVEQAAAAPPGDPADAAPPGPAPPSVAPATPEAPLSPLTPSGVGQLGPPGIAGLLAPPAVNTGLSASVEQVSGAAGTPPAVAALAPNPPNVAPAAVGRVLTVDPSGQTPGGFTSLASAASEARSGDTIELRFTGAAVEKPLELARLQLKIRAAEGFFPVLLFQPSGSDPIVYPRSMFTLIGSRLALEGVAVELIVPRDVHAESWTMFELGQGESLDLDGSSLTIRNALDAKTAYHREVSFLRLKKAPSADLPTLEGPAAPPRVSVTLRNCIVRGEAGFVRFEHPQPLYLAWDNGFLATSESFLSADGSDLPPSADHRVQVELNHVTAIALAGLYRWSNHSNAPQPQLPVRFRVDRSVLLGTPSAPLIEQDRATDESEARAALTMDGSENLYEGFRDYWNVIPFDPEAPRWTVPFDRLATLLSSAEAELFTAAPPSGPLAPEGPIHAARPSDYLLDWKYEENPDLILTGDGWPAGSLAAELPQLLPGSLP